jgi:predicted MFS family arabinose efflux permease
MVDRLGSRRIALLGVVAFPALFACLGLTSGSIWMWWGLWVLLSVAAPLVTTLVWTSAVSSRFVAGRGLALAATLSGTSLTQIVGPPVANALIKSWGWREAFLGLGLLWGGTALLLVFLFFRGARDAGRRAEPAAPRAMAGLTLHQALRSIRIWRIAFCELFTATLIVATLFHLVPILVSLNVLKDNAVALASLVGFAAIAGKLCTGFMLDRWQSGWVASLTMWLPALAFMMLLAGGAGLGPWLVVPVILFGYAVGGYYQTVTDLTTRYAGLRSFGKIYGLMTSLMAVGTGAGPWIAGRIFDVTGHYSLWLIVGAMISLVSGLLVFRLGPYPIWVSAADPREALQ